MSDSNSHISQIVGAQALDSIALPHDVAAMLTNEARRRHKTVAQYLREWLEDQADAREAARRMGRIKSGKSTAIPADEVYASLGI